ncbi:lipoprotein [Rossellomorea aquimaris]|nr:lipoprotein [Rossellomorea aquimaris]
MKKVWVLGLGLTLALAGCSDTGSDEAKKEDTSKASEETTNVAGELMDFYLNLTTTVNGVDIDLNGFEEAMAGEEPPAGEELAEMKEAASASATESAKVVEGMEIPEGLGEQKEDVESFKSTLAESYNMKAEALSKEGEADLTAANEKLTEAENQIKEILEEAGLVSSSLISDING